MFVGHVGDGNFHVILIFDPENAGEIQRIHEFGTILSKYKIIRLLFINLCICRESLRVNGTITGEHGIGLGKKQLLIDEFGLQGISTMRAIKQALDPLNILNPGKVIDMNKPF